VIIEALVSAFVLAAEDWIAALGLRDVVLPSFDISPVFAWGRSFDAFLPVSESLSAADAVIRVVLVLFLFRVLVTVRRMIPLV